MVRRILVTGSRTWTDVEAIRSALVAAGRELEVHPQEVTVVHGGARGADSLADRVAKEFGCTVEAHPADWDRHGKRAGMLRNIEMVEAGADVVLAFFDDSPCIGTRACVRAARRAGLRVVEHQPDTVCTHPREATA